MKHFKTKAKNLISRRIAVYKDHTYVYQRRKRNYKWEWRTIIIKKDSVFVPSWASKEI